MDLLVCFGSLSKPKFVSAWRSEQVGGYSPSGRLGRQQNLCFHLSQHVFQVLEQQNSPRLSHCHHPILMSEACSFSEIWCYFYATCNETHIIQRVQLLSHLSIESLPESLWDHQEMFWKKLRWALPFFLFSSVFCLGALPCRPFLPNLVVMVEAWPLNLLWDFLCTIEWVVLAVILVSWLILGSFTAVPCLRHVLLITGCNLSLHLKNGFPD